MKWIEEHRRDLNKLCKDNVLTLWQYSPLLMGRPWGPVTSLTERSWREPGKKKTKLDGCQERDGSRLFFSLCAAELWKGSSVYYRPSSLTFVLKGDPGVGQCHISRPSCSVHYSAGSPRQLSPYCFCAALVVISLRQTFRTQMAFSVTSCWVLWLLNDRQRSFTPFLNPIVLLIGQREKLPWVLTAVVWPQIAPRTEWTVANRVQN